MYSAKTSSKRIAVVFAGQPRTFRHCYKSHLEFFRLDGYDFDFFIHAWSDQWYRIKSCSEHTVSNAYLEDDALLGKELVEIYKPKVIVVERQKECKPLLDDMKALIRLQGSTDNQCWHNNNQSYTGGGWCRNHKDGVGRWLDGIHSGQIYSWQQVTNLKIDYEKENNFEYDGVIKFRLDNFLDTHKDSTKKEIFEKACAPKLKFEHTHFQSNGYLTVGDMFFCGENEEFNKLMKNIYTFLIREYCNVLGDIDGRWKHAGPPETIISKKLAHNKIATNDVRCVSHFPYREYHIDAEDQSYKNLFKMREQVSEKGVQR